MKSITRLTLLIWIGMYSLTGVMAADINSTPIRQISNTTGKACTDSSPEATTKLGLIQQMLADGKPHAAIAHLDATRIKGERAELLRAHGLRQTGREAQARVIYEQLLRSCVSGHAYRGLGLIASNAGNLQESLRYLKAASDALPTEHTIRNDHGYVLMLAGESELAMHEFLTALELAPDYRQAAHNMILLLYKQGEVTKAETFATKFGVVTEEMQQIKRMAQK